jgi:hypothetical protein
MNFSFVNSIWEQLSNSFARCQTQTVLIHLPQFIEIHATWASTRRTLTISTPDSARTWSSSVGTPNTTRPSSRAICGSFSRACACQPPCLAAFGSHCNGWQMPPITCLHCYGSKVRLWHSWACYKNPSQFIHRFSIRKWNGQDGTTKSHV